MNVIIELLESKQQDAILILGCQTLTRFIYSQVRHDNVYDIHLSGLLFLSLLVVSVGIYLLVKELVYSSCAFEGILFSITKGAATITPKLSSHIDILPPKFLIH